MTYNYYSNNMGLPFKQQLLDQFTNELQWHSDFTVSFLLQGTVNINIQNRGHLLAENDLFFLEPFHSYSVIATSDPVKVLSFSIDYEFIRQICPDIDSIALSTNYLRYKSNTDLHVMISKNIGQIILHTMKHGSCDNLKCLSAISNILTLLIDSFGTKQEKTDIPANYTQNRIKEIIEYINENYAKKITLQTVSGQLGIHPQYFSTFFKKHFRKNFVEYLTDFRIQHSLSALSNTSDSILDIAISHGFNNHKTYSTAFKKLYNISPTEYRKEQAASRQSSSFATTQDGYFYFFQKFWNNEDDNNLHKKNRIQTHMSVTLDLLSPDLPIFKNKQPIFIDGGRASSCLRNEVQEQIREAKKDFNFNFLRLRDIFSDDLFVYYEESDKVSLYNWQYIDIIFDFLLSIQIRPFIELGFMPRYLASKKQYAGWHFHPNVSFPKSTEKWGQLVANFMKHCIERYSLAEVRNWFFDFWACPDLQIKDGYWNESMESFFEFYHITYNAIKNIDSNLQLGSPNFSAPAGLSWYESFFLYCNAHQLEPAYISLHLYGCDTMATTSDDFISYSDEFLKPASIPDKRSISHNISHLQELMTENGFEKLRILVSNWNVSFYPGDLTRDTCFMGPYIAYVSSITMNQVFGLCYRSLSDINEDFFPNSTLFHGGSGLMDFYGLKKASYNTFSLYCKLGKTIIETNDHYIIAQSERGYQILVFNLSFYDSLYRLSDRSALSYAQRYNVYEATDDFVIHIMLSLLPGIYSVKKSMVNRDSGSAYDLWVKMESPQTLNSSLVEYMKNKSIPDISYYTEEITNTLIIDELIPAHGVVLFEIEKTLQ